ncbi:MAG: leucine-rich repeat protein [Bacteroidales bacterium]|nr:leucine-rich repeat protein [Bacteroidales bacterium]
MIHYRLSVCRHILREANAFRECYDLEQIHIPETIKTIGESAFQDAELHSLHIHGSLSFVGKNAFNCPSLSLIYLYEINPFTSNLAPECFFFDSESMYRHITLYVRSQSLSAYKSHPFFSKFGVIKAI